MKIIKIYANESTFRETTFNDDLSVVIADITEKSTEKDSRNGLGKTLLVEVINFCLGSNISSTLSKTELKSWIFGIKVEITGSTYNFERATATNGYVKVTGDLDCWPIKTDEDSLTIKIEDFRRVLGVKIFGISHVTGNTGQLSYRNLMSYFMRTDPTAFVSPFKYVSNQKALSAQMANAYLLGLNYDYVYRFRDIEQKKELLSNLEKAATSGMLNGVTGNLGELEAQRVRIKQILSRLELQVANFRVHEEYYEIQNEADIYTKDIHKLLNEFSLYEQTIKQYEENIEEENDITVKEVEAIYNEAGIYFSERITKKLDDIQNFHKTVVKNREQYLKDEIKRLEALILEKRRIIESLSAKKENIMTVLNSHGALEEFSQLQNRVSLIRQQLGDVSSRIDKLNEFSDGTSRIAIEIQELVQAIRQDHKERQGQIEEAISIFNYNSEALYAEPGTLSILINNKGYKFDVDIKRAASGGISNMKVFCYDLLIAEISSRLHGRPVPLIHDSRIFDGVDERQIAKALKLAYQKSKECGFQYICTINSDDVPYGQFDDGFKNIFNKSIVQRYNDSDPSGTLLGFRF